MAGILIVIHHAESFLPFSTGAAVIAASMLSCAIAFPHLFFITPHHCQVQLSAGVFQVLPPSPTHLPPASGFCRELQKKSDKKGTSLAAFLQTNSVGQSLPGNKFTASPIHPNVSRLTSRHTPILGRGQHCMSYGTKNPVRDEKTMDGQIN